MSKLIADTHNFVDRLTEGSVFSRAQAERLKDVISEQLDVVTTDRFERGLQRVVIQLLTAMLAQTALIVTAVQWITSA